jgi:hypothetical protein
LLDGQRELAAIRAHGHAIHVSRGRELGDTRGCHLGRLAAGRDMQQVELRAVDSSAGDDEGAVAAVRGDLGHLGIELRRVRQRFRGQQLPGRGGADLDIRPRVVDYDVVRRRRSGRPRSLRARGSGRGRRGGTVRKGHRRGAGRLTRLRLDGAGRADKHSGRLVDRAVLPEPQHEHGALASREQPACPQQFLPVEHGRRGVASGSGYRDLHQEHLGTPAPGPPLVPGQVDEYRAGVSLGVLAGGRPVPGRAQQGCLNEILGVMPLPGQQDGEPEQPAAVAADTTLEIRLVIARQTRAFPES